MRSIRIDSACRPRHRSSRERGDAAVLDARLRLEFEGRHHRSGIDLHHRAEHVELFELRFDAHRDILQFLLVVGIAALAFVEQIGGGKRIGDGSRDMRGQPPAQGSPTGADPALSGWRGSSIGQMGISAGSSGRLQPRARFAPRRLLRCDRAGAGSGCSAGLGLARRFAVRSPPSAASLLLISAPASPRATAASILERAGNTIGPANHNASFDIVNVETRYTETIKVVMVSRIAPVGLNACTR